MSESQTPTQDQRCQSGPSAKNSVVPSEAGFSKNNGADQQRLQISDPHLDQFSTSATFACWTIRFKTEVCTCSKALPWIKEVELVDSVDDLKSSCSVRGIQMPNFEVLDARIVSALNKIIHNSQFKRKVSLWRNKKPKKRIAFSEEDRLLTWSTITFGSLEPMILSIIMPTYLHYDDIQEFNSKWDGTLLSMTKIPPDDILEGLYKLRIRESEKLKAVLELYDLEIHQRTLGPDYHRLKTMVKRSIEQDIRNKNFGIRNGNYEKNAVVKNQGTKQHEQRILRDCWQWKASDTIWISVQNRHIRILLRDLLRSRVWEMHWEPEVLEAEAQVGKMARLPCARITSKELAPLHSVNNGILQNACSASPKMDAG